ncbi:tachykinin-like peptides receptor 86C [Exaiptasia diaphana]|uniref:G-protein coupled receptors family 1 profile domain-containing protein n=1 Tax=Exaiptasia diaphana TaxID=2652724 RepID=A0A913XFI0_EXADI|nr:tachykinin-like peptides receptor 86C [Exaiptasia diaphana]XP_028515851.1 tachykinin-like peptides receptor 86C [Exaiptasia diaphana]
MNNSTASTLHYPAVSPYSNLGWSAAFGVEAVVIAVGNGISILALIYMKSPRKLRRWFLLSLSIADMFVGALSLPMYVYLLTVQTRLKSMWFVYNTVDIFTGLASVFTLTVISMERLYAVLMPFTHRYTRRIYYMIVIGGLWCLAALISGVFWLTMVYHLLPKELFIYPMTIVSFASVGIISVVYVTVWIKIKFFVSKRSNAKLLGPGEEKNIFFAIGIVTVVFVCTWLPFNIMNLMANFHHKVISDLPYDSIYFVKFLHYCNSFINPVVYTLKIPEFRRSIYRLFHVQSSHSCPRGLTRETRV